MAVQHMDSVTMYAIVNIHHRKFLPIREDAFYSAIPARGSQWFPEKSVRQKRNENEEKDQKLLGYGGIGGKICFFLKYWRLDVILLQNCYNFTKQEVRGTKEKNGPGRVF